ncbi:MAG: glycosyltransferase family 4 protein [Chlamydiia bacterium]|nr:glycosyltransferase family 4 protein [Chlamydiia bacterium]
MKILHTEAATGLGGQELRILNEAIGLRERGHEIVMAVQSGGQLIERAREKGFQVYPFDWRWRRFPTVCTELRRIVRGLGIDLICTHSSKDAWLAGVSARLLGVPVVRMRHLSTPIRQGFNSRILYGVLARRVATTCHETAVRIARQAGLDHARCYSVPTGVRGDELVCDPAEVAALRLSYGFDEGCVVVGSLCVMRSWKGMEDLIEAAALVKAQGGETVRWLLVGDGPALKCFQEYAQKLGVEERVVFAGYHRQPAAHLAAMDLFALPSRAHEGVSQAILQAGYMAKPLIATTVGGLGEVCIDGVTGYQVPIKSSQAIARAVLACSANGEERRRMGLAAQQLVMDKFTFDETLDKMEHFYAEALR